MEFIKEIFRVLFCKNYGIKTKKYKCPCGSKIEVAFYSGSSGGGTCENCGGRISVN